MAMWLNENQPQDISVAGGWSDRWIRKDAAFSINKNATDMGTSVAVRRSNQKAGLTARQRRAHGEYRKQAPILN